MEVEGSAPALTPEAEMIMKLANELSSINPLAPVPPPPPPPPQVAIRAQESVAPPAAPAEEFDLPPDIDPAFLEALPEELRAEVLEQHANQQRAAAVPPQSTTEQEAFLEALPPDIRAEVI
jgi:E3 ubiquitin-protein ligase HUWE1